MSLYLLRQKKQERLNQIKGASSKFREYSQVRASYETEILMLKEFIEELDAEILVLETRKKELAHKKNLARTSYDALTLKNKIKELSFVLGEKE